jgi:hypothetical protein
MNKLYVGLTTSIELPDKGGFLLIDDEVQDVARARVFDPLKHSFNPLKDIDHKKAREIADVLYAISPQGENTLTVRNGKRSLPDALLSAGRFDKVDGDEEVMGMANDLLFTPLLSKVLCSADNQFSFNPRSIIFARLNRAELGERDALALGVLLMSHYKGQVIVPDLGFYGRDIHVGLLREKRLIGGVNFLDELPSKLRQHCLLIKDKEVSGALVEDAEELAKFEGHVRGTQGFTDYVKTATE